MLGLFGLGLSLAGGRILAHGPVADAALVAGAAVWGLAAILRVRRAGAVLAAPYAAVAAALAVPAGLAVAGSHDVSPLIHVAWTALLAVALPVWVALERTAAGMVVAAAVARGPLRRAAVRGATTGFWLIAIVALNWSVSQRDAKWDLTYFKTTRPSETTVAQVQAAGDAVEALLFFGPTDEAWPEVERYFEALAAAGAPLTLRRVDQALEPELARVLKIRSNGWIVVRRRGKEGETATERIEIGETFERARKPLRNLDAKVGRAVARLGEGERRVAFTSGHHERTRAGEPDAPAGQRLGGLYQLLDRFAIATQALGLADGLANGVPEGVGAVVVAGPRAPFLPEERDALLRHVRAGGRLLLLLEPPAPAGSPRDDGLEPLLHALGLARRPGVVCAEKSHLRRTFSPADRGLVVASGYSTHPIVTTANRNAGRVATLFAAGTALQEARESGRIAGAKVAFPLRTGTDGFLDRDGDWTRDADEPLERLELVAAVTLPPAERGGAEGRVVVIGDGDVVTDAVIQNPGNAVLFVDALRWLIGEESVDATPESEEDVALEHRREDDAIWFYGTAFGAPLPLLGVAWWMARRRRRGVRTEASDA